MGCLYWVFFGWWIELYKWFFIFMFKIIYWVCFGFWVEILKDKKTRKAFFQITLAVICIAFAVVVVSEFWKIILLILGICAIIYFIYSHPEFYTRKRESSSQTESENLYIEEAENEYSETQETLTVNPIPEEKQKTTLEFIIENLDKTRELERIINNTKDEKEFFLSLNELNRTFYDLSMYEDVFDFSIPPSDELKRLSDNREKYINSLYKRMNKNITPEKMDVMSGYEFEEFCSGLLIKNGFEKVELTKKSGDHGIDILAEKDGITYAVQCKCYSSNIGNSAIQQAHAGKGFYGKDIAAVMTNRYFTPQAKEEAETLSVKLWDRDYIIVLIKKTEEPDSDL